MESPRVIDDDSPRFRITFVESFGSYLDGVLEDVFGRVHTDYMRGYFRSWATYSYKKISSFGDLTEKIEFGLIDSISKVPTQEEIMAADNRCDICDKNYEMPVKVPCGHIFCKICIVSRLRNNVYCPTCQARIYFMTMN